MPIVIFLQEARQYLARGARLPLPPTLGRESAMQGSDPPRTRLAPAASRRRVSDRGGPQDRPRPSDRGGEFTLATARREGRRRASCARGSGGWCHPDRNLRQIVARVLVLPQVRSAATPSPSCSGSGRTTAPRRDPLGQSGILRLACAAHADITGEPPSQSGTEPC